MTAGGGRRTYTMVNGEKIFQFSGGIICRAERVVVVGYKGTHCKLIYRMHHVCAVPLVEILMFACFVWKCLPTERFRLMQASDLSGKHLKRFNSSTQCRDESKCVYVLLYYYLCAAQSHVPQPLCVKSGKHMLS